MDKSRRLSLLGLASGIAVIFLVLTGSDFGYPGYASYLDYERFNRIVSVLLVLQSSSLIGLYFWKKESLGKHFVRLIKSLIVAWWIMALGTAAEFWLFSDLPYPRSPGDFNLRVAAFTLFSLGALTSGISMSVLGFRALRKAWFSKSLSLIMLLYLPGFFLSFFYGWSVFVAPAIMAIAIAAFHILNSEKA